MANEASLPRSGNWRTRVINSNVFTILRRDVQIYGSMAATDMYAIGKEDQHQILMRLKEMQREREKSALLSVKVTPRSVTEASLMHGALGFLAGQTGDEIDTTTTALTETVVNTVVGACWESGANSLSFYGNKTQTGKFTQWDKDRIRTTINEGKGGGRITKYLGKPVVGEVLNVSAGGAQACLPQRFPRFSQIELFMVVDGMAFRGRAEVAGVDASVHGGTAGGQFRHSLRWVSLEGPARDVLTKIVTARTPQRAESMV